MFKQSFCVGVDEFLHKEEQPVHPPFLAYFHFIRQTAERITGTEGSQY